MVNYLPETYSLRASSRFGRAKQASRERAKEKLMAMNLHGANHTFFYLLTGFGFYVLLPI